MLRMIVIQMVVRKIAIPGCGSVTRQQKVMITFRFLSCCWESSHQALEKRGSTPQPSPRQFTMFNNMFNLSIKILRLWCLWQIWGMENGFHTQTKPKPVHLIPPPHPLINAPTLINARLPNLSCAPPKPPAVGWIETRQVSCWRGWQPIRRGKKTRTQLFSPFLSNFVCAHVREGWQPIRRGKENTDPTFSPFFSNFVLHWRSSLFRHLMCYRCVWLK